MTERSARQSQQDSEAESLSTAAWSECNWRDERCCAKTDGPAVAGVGERSECVDLSVLPVPADDHVAGASRATGVVLVAAAHRDAGHFASGDKEAN